MDRWHTSHYEPSSVVLTILRYQKSFKPGMLSTSPKLKSDTWSYLQNSKGVKTMVAALLVTMCLEVKFFLSLTLNDPILKEDSVVRIPFTS